MRKFRSCTVSINFEDGWGRCDGNWWRLCQISALGLNLGIYRCQKPALIQSASGYLGKCRPGGIRKAGLIEEGQNFSSSLAKYSEYCPRPE